MLTRLAIAALCLSVVFAGPVFRPVNHGLGAGVGAGAANGGAGASLLAFQGNSTNCTTNFFGTNCDVFCNAAATCNNNGTCTKNGLCSCSNTVWGAFCNKTLPTVLLSQSFTAGASGKTVSLGGNSKFKLVLPPGALAGNANLEAFVLDPNDSNAPKVDSTQQPGLTLAGSLLRLLPRGQTFLTPITVTFEVSSTIVVPTGFTIKVYKLDEETNLWAEVGGTYDPSTGTVDVSLSSFSIYGSMVTPDTSSSSSSGTPGVSTDGNSSNTVVVAIVVSVVGAVALLVFGMCGVAYFKRKEANKEQAPPAQAYPQQPVQYTAAA